MINNPNTWNASLMTDWAEAQRQYWDTLTKYAKSPSVPGIGDGRSAGSSPFAGFNPFTANPFTQGLFAQNPFAQNTLMANPFSQFAGPGNPFSGAMEQWWASIRPNAQSDIATVAHRFYDMGKSFMSMAEGVFGAAGQEQPQAAMNIWMSSIQAMLQQWITQIQNNMDVATPDLPGISGTMLSTWASFADSVAPWLNMSQQMLKEIAEGHLPGGVEMPGVGAAQEQLLRALSIPGLGYTREQQERLQLLARDLLGYHEAVRAYKLAFAKTALSSLDSVQSRLQSMHEEGERIESLRALYDLWVDVSENAYAKFAMSDEYQVVYGDLVNALMRVRRDMNEMAEHQYRMMNIPTRSEIDTMQRRQQEIRRESRRLRGEIAELRMQLAEPGGGRLEAGGARGSRRSAPPQDSPPTEDARDDLTAIKGVGPKMAEKLYAQGIRNFTQLATMNTTFAEQLDESLKTQGRILRDDWIGQAKKLMG